MMSLRFFVFGRRDGRSSIGCKDTRFAQVRRPGETCATRHNFGGGAGHFAGALVPDNDTVLYQLKTKVDPAQQQR
jgi:hypothetical protein